MSFDNEKNDDNRLLDPTENKQEENFDRSLRPKSLNLLHLELMN